MAIYMMRDDTQTYTYSYDFKWKTTSQILQERSELLGSIQVNSDWVTWGNNSDLRIKKDIPSLATAKRITISWTVVASNGTQNAWQLAIGKWTSWGTGNCAYDVYGSYYGWLCVTYYNGTSYYWNVVGYSTWWNTYKPTLTIDLENKTMTWVLSWFSNSTYSLSDTDVANIRQFEYLFVYTSLNYSTVSDVSLTIEY